MVDPPPLRIPCDVLLESIRDWTVRAITSALRRAEAEPSERV